MKLWRRFKWWMSGHDRRMRMLARLSRDEASEFYSTDDTNMKWAVDNKLAFEVPVEHVESDWELFGYKLADAGAAAVEQWKREGGR